MWNLENGAPISRTGIETQIERMGCGHRWGKGKMGQIGRLGLTTVCKTASSGSLAQCYVMIRRAEVGGWERGLKREGFMYL